MIATYKGRPVTDLTREELIDAYTELSVQSKAERAFTIESNALLDELNTFLGKALGMCAATRTHKSPKRDASGLSPSAT